MQLLLGLLGLGSQMPWACGLWQGHQCCRDTVAYYGLRAPALLGVVKPTLNLKTQAFNRQCCMFMSSAPKTKSFSLLFSKQRLGTKANVQVVLHDPWYLRMWAYRLTALWS